MLAERDFDAILLDLAIAESDGLAALESIVQCLPDIPIVILPQQTQATSVTRAADGCTQKSLCKDAVQVETITRLIGYSLQSKLDEPGSVDTERRIANEILDVISNTAGDDMYAAVLDLIVSGFASRFGFFLRHGLEGSGAICHLIDRGDGTKHSSTRNWTETNSGDSEGLISKLGGFGSSFDDEASGTNQERSFLEAPVRYGNEILGVIRIAGRDVAYDEEEQHSLPDLARLVAPVLGAGVQVERRECEYLITEDALLAEQARTEVALRLTGDAVISTDGLGLIDYLNPVAQEITGWSAPDAIGQPIEDVFCIFHEETREAVSNLVFDCLNGDKTIESDRHTILINRAGNEFSIKGSAAPVRGRDQGVHGAVLVFGDFTETQRMAREISHQANHDALTGLMNRGAFEERLQRVLGTARADESQHALCVLDLDQFKVINDTCGHSAGDELLRQFAQCLRDNVHTRSSTSRIGGDEFSILMEHCSLEEAENVIGGLRQSIDEFRFSWDGQSLRIGASFGLVPITAHNESVSAILRAADAACETAKGRGRNRLHVAQEDDVEVVHRHGEMQWVARINDALENDRFCLYFQPIESLVAEPQVGAHFELLLRMIGDDGIVLPSVFLPVAERYVLATRIDRWVLERALHWLRADAARLAEIEQCTINLSGQSLGDEEFLEFVLDNLQSTPNIAKKICFEITETAAIRNLSKGIRFITTLKEQGCRFALDDFGSGLSSFGYLKSLPVDYLKIDGQFVRDILVDPIDLAMVKSIHDIAKVMGKCTIAEFVESAEILELLKGIGVDFVQGHAIAPPRALEQFRV